MTGLFAQLMQELGSILRLPLHPDKLGACSILIATDLIIQFQLDPSQENLFFFSKIMALPPGKFRENIFASALKANAQADPRAGILAYHAASDFLILFQKYPVFILNGERLAGLFGGFLEMVQSWQNAIRSGQSGPAPSSLKHPGPLGIR